MTSNIHSSDTNTGPPSKESLAHRRHRYLLYCLYLYTNPMKLADIAYQLAVWEKEMADPEDDHLQQSFQTYMSLYHDHVPELSDRDIIVYDQREDVVELGAIGETVKPTLERQLIEEVDELLRIEGESGETSVPPPVEDVYRVLTSSPRQRLLYALLDQPRMSADRAIDVLAARQATDTGTVDPEERSDWHTALYRIHLPILENAGFVTYDPDICEITLEPLPGVVRDLIRSVYQFNR